MSGSDRPFLDIEGLPGADLAREGLADAERLSAPACLVWMGLPRLRRHGLAGGELKAPIVEPERVMYALLRKEGGDAFSRYNALLRRRVSFERALDRRASRLGDRKSRLEPADDNG